MTKKNMDIINEGVVRRWGKLANLNKLTESFIDNTQVVAEEEEELEVELPADDSEDLASAEDAMELEVPMDAEMEAEPAVALDEDQVEALTQAFATALSQVTGVEVEVEAESDMPADDMDMGAEMPADDMGAEMPADELEPELGDEEEVFNRTDSDDEDEDQVTEAAKADADDEEEDSSSDLTEAVLKRVIERLLATK